MNATEEASFFSMRRLDEETDDEGLVSSNDTTIIRQTLRLYGSLYLICFWYTVYCADATLFYLTSAVGSQNSSVNLQRENMAFLIGSGRSLMSQMKNYSKTVGWTQCASCEHCEWGASYPFAGAFVLSG
jgi:hypothetical protein